MGEVFIRGKREDGMFEVELKRTPVLITELIHDMFNMSKMDIYKRLCDIRESAERDDRVSQTYVNALKKGETHE